MKLLRKVFGISLMFDLVNACSFACPSCPVGNSPKRRGGKMSLATFMEIVTKIREEVPIKYVLLYSFSEPFLHPQLADFVGYLKDKGIRTMISTNLSRPGNVEAVMAAGLDELRISFSGWRHGEYFHKGRDLKQFMSACDHVHKVMGYYKTKVSLIWHKYRTNADEQSQVEEFARMHHFDLIVEPAFFIPYDKIVGDTYTPEDLRLIEHLDKKPWEITGKRKESCYYQNQQLCIDALGRVFLCRHVWSDGFIVGNILEDSVWKILENMSRHSFCVACKDHHLNNYTP